ncbi:MAG: flagellin [Rhodocyclaceae bacterium]|nr:flagellin [Rhodocyclaceae bacterium]
MIVSIPSPANSLTQAAGTLDKTLNRLSTGLRINAAKDDAAGLAIATRLAAQLGSDNQALRNINDGLSVAETAGGALGQVSDSLQRMRELALQAANGTNSAADLQAVQTEISQLGQGIDQISAQTQFNGQKLLSGGFSTQIQTGPNVGDTQPLSLGNVSAQGLGIAGLDVTTAAGADNALQAIDQAIAGVGAQQGAVGAAQASLNSASAAVSGTYENLAAAKSRIGDTDFAGESASLAQAGVRLQAAQKALSLYNANQSTVLGLLPKA